MTPDAPVFAEVQDKLHELLAFDVAMQSKRGG